MAFSERLNFTIDKGNSQSSSTVVHTMPQLMASELLGRRAALTDIVTAHVKGLLRIDELNGRILTLCAPWPWSREDTPDTEFFRISV